MVCLFLVLEHGNMGCLFQTMNLCFDTRMNESTTAAEYVYYTNLGISYLSLISFLESPSRSETYLKWADTYCLQSFNVNFKFTAVSINN